MRDTRRRVCANAHASADLMIHYEEKVNGATISMREGGGQNEGRIRQKVPKFLLVLSRFREIRKDSS